jgi:asparagine synthase (glutamine-hydrolysing)
VKSLYWAKEGDRLIFASRAGAVRSAQQRPGQVNPAAVMQYLLFSVVPAPLVIYEGMKKLRPGFFLTYDKGQVREESYWDLAYAESEKHDERYWAQEVREGLRAAVHRHLEGCAGETTGAYLSGGTDSSSVVAFMAERFSPVNTFSIYFPETRYSEIGFARTTAEHFHTRHHERCLNSVDARAAIPRIIEYYDEPFANSSAIGAYYCARMARENGVETLLAGDGGDELFGGNERYASDKRFALYHSLPRWVRGLLEPAVKLLPSEGGMLSLPRRYIERARIPNPRRIFSYGLFLSDHPAKVFEPGFLEQVPPEQWMEIADGHFHAAHASSELNRLLYLDLKLILADNDLRKVSGTAELAGVRVRYPLLDHRLAELSARIPTRLKLKGFEKRYIFKRAVTGILPHEVIYKKKHGFGVPLGQWFLDDPQLSSFVQDVLNDSRTRQRGYFRQEFFEQLMVQHRREHSAYYGEIVWCLVALELWHRQHLESHREVAHVS